jgi:hypothetical protein
VPRPSRAPLIDNTLLALVDRHPADLVAQVARRLGISRAAIGARARALVDDGYLIRRGTTRPTYRSGPHRRAAFRHRLARIDEDRVWTADVVPLLAGLPVNVRDICHYGITEMVNNAIDHSAGKTVEVTVERSQRSVDLVVADDGVGIFDKITRALRLPDPRLALLELAKGKLTTDPRHHSGEGIFFASRMFDHYEIASGTLRYRHDASSGRGRLDEGEDPESTPGTRVTMSIAPDTTRSARQVFDAYSSGPDEYAFARTVVPVRLARIGDENLISRSQARRVLQRVDRFRIVELDFDGVATIGQAFADEIFRVFAREHPEIELTATHARPDVQQMIRRAETLRDET